MRSERVFHREVVQAELLLDLAKNLRVRLVETDPHEPIRRPAAFR